MGILDVLFGRNNEVDQRMNPLRAGTGTTDPANNEVDQLINSLRTGTGQADSAKTLVKLGVKAHNRLFYVLKNGDDDDRTYAALGLGLIADIGAVDQLIGALSDKYWDVRSQAARALGKIGDAQALEHLKQSLINEGTIYSGTKYMIGNRVVTDMSDTVRTNVREAISAIEQGRKIPIGFGID